MKRLGIFLGFTPNQLVPHEGISRLIGFIVRGAVGSGEVSVTIAGPSWLRKDIKALLEDANIPVASVDIVTLRNEPYIVKIWRVLDRFRLRPLKKTEQRYRLKRFVHRFLMLLTRWLSTSSTASFFLGAIAASVLAIIFAVPAVMAGVLFGILLVFRRVMRGARGHRFAVRFWKAYRSARRKLALTLGLVNVVREKELGRLVSKLNKRKDIDVWYVPSMFWPEVSKIRGKVVMAAPDIVFYEHPSQYIGPDFDGVMERMTESLASADHLITYSEYVKDAHIVKRQKISGNKVSVIRHGVVETQAVERGEGSRQEALDVLHEYIDRKKSSMPKYLEGYRFDDVQFLFYSSQVRPHKNIEGLVAVYEKILREHYRPVKLVLTGKISGNERIMDLIDHRGLERDVLSLPAVPNEVLAALYRLAALSVTPTMFEGGFPFTFTEAYSVGTPSVMSRIPVVTEIIKGEALLDMMTFDPRNRDEMLQKILWALDNRDELLEAQRPLFQAMSSRTWSKVADEYIALMRKVAEE